MRPVSFGSAGLLEPVRVTVGRVLGYRCCIEGMSEAYCRTLSTVMRRVLERWSWEGRPGADRSRASVTCELFFFLSK